MSSRTRLILFLLVPAAVVAASAIWFVGMGGGGEGRATESRLHASGPEELTRRMDAAASEMTTPDLFTLEDGVVYVRRNRDRLKAFTVTDRVAGVIAETHRKGEPWGPNMAGVLPPGTRLYHVINEPELLAAKTESEAETVFYTQVAFDREPVR